MYKVRVFNQLAGDTDVNLTNVFGEDWKIWRVDFTRAFRLHKNLKDPKDLVRCERKLFDKLKTLDGNELAAKTKGYLTKDELKAVMARRDKIVRYSVKRAMSSAFGVCSEVPTFASSGGRTG